MHNIRLTIAYDGTEFCGWQIQPGQPTIQGALTELLSRITREEVTLNGAGRTDAGVHAWGQVASFKTASEISPRELARALNALLPPAIRVRQAEEVGPDFHARWAALAKTYRYRLYCGEIASPFEWRYVLHHPARLDFAAMAEAARCFEGEHDFTSFAASTGDAEEDQQRLVQRCVFRSEFLPASALERCGGNHEDHAAGGAGVASLAEEPRDQEWVYVVRGQSFLRHMVRKIVGTLLEVGRGRLTPADIPRLLELRDRTSSGPTAPPHGLCLVSVEYSDRTQSLSDLPGANS